MSVTRQGIYATLTYTPPQAGGPRTYYAVLWFGSAEVARWKIPTPVQVMNDAGFGDYEPDDLRQRDWVDEFVAGKLAQALNTID